MCFLAHAQSSRSATTTVMWLMPFWIGVARPIARGRQRTMMPFGRLVRERGLDVEPVEVDVLLLLLRVAIALLSSLLTSGAAALRVNFSWSMATATSWPRTMFSTTRALRVEIRAYFKLALGFHVRLNASPVTRVGRRRRRLAVGRVAAEGARRRELAELVTDHVLVDEHGDELAAVVHGEGSSPRTRA